MTEKLSKFEIACLMVGLFCTAASLGAFGRSVTGWAHSHVVAVKVGM